MNNLAPQMFAITYVSSNNIKGFYELGCTENIANKSYLVVLGDEDFGTP